jgi:sugar-specific transcriptional regulator TrmB
MDKEIVNNLESLGYTNYESKVFYALFTGENMTTSEIAKSAGIPRSSAYEILKNFTQQGICNEIETSSVVRYQLIDPKVISDKIENEIRKSFKSKIANLKQSFEVLEPLYHNKEAKSEKVDVQLIRGFNRNRHLKLIELIKNAKQEILYMNKLEGFVEKEGDEATMDFIKRGGVIKSIYEAQYNFKIRVEGNWQNVSPQGLIELCRHFENNGEKIKLTENIYQVMAVFDRETVFVSLVDKSIPKYNRSDIIIKNSNYANAMVDYFNTCWANALTIDQFEESKGTKN